MSKKNECRRRASTYLIFVGIYKIWILWGNFYYFLGQLHELRSKKQKSLYQKSSFGFSKEKTVEIPIFIYKYDGMVHPRRVVCLLDAGEVLPS